MATESPTTCRADLGRLVSYLEAMRRLGCVPVTQAEAGAALGMTARRIRALARRARGVLICTSSTDPAGIWLGNEVEYRESCLGRIRRFKRGLIDAYRDLKAVVPPGQLPLLHEDPELLKWLEAQEASATPRDGGEGHVETGFAETGAADTGPRHELAGANPRDAEAGSAAGGDGPGRADPALVLFSTGETGQVRGLSARRRWHS